MFSLQISLLLSLILAACVSAQNSICEFFHVPPLQCQICGYAPSAPVYCIAYNATFDDLPSAAPVPTYGNVNWTNFDVIAAPDTAGISVAAVAPYSPPNFAHVPSGQEGVMIMGVNGGIDNGHDGQFPVGTLHYFHYACASSPAVSGSAPTAAACTVSVTGSCLTSDSGFLTGNFSSVEANFVYVPAADGSMAFESQDFGTIQTAEVTSQRCANYTFVANSVDGLAVDLLLDDVIYNTFTEGYNG